MIEIICREDQKEQQTAQLSLPRNIRQVGSPKGRHKIYIEDYVYTYLRAKAGKNAECAAVLLGKSSISKDMRYTFISGAIECGQAVFQWENIRLDESFWEYIYDEQKQYFEDTRIIGWFVGAKGQELPPSVESAHRKYFAGRDKILMLMDQEEQEEVFYIYEQGYLQKKEGYYIYYEKNVQMQEYMVSKKEEGQRNPQPPREEEPLWRSPESDSVPAPSEQWEELHRELEGIPQETAQGAESIPLKQDPLLRRRAEGISPEQDLLLRQRAEGISSEQDLLLRRRAEGISPEQDLLLRQRAEGISPEQDLLLRQRAEGISPEQDLLSGGRREDVSRNSLLHGEWKDLLPKVFRHKEAEHIQEKEFRGSQERAVISKSAENQCSEGKQSGIETQYGTGSQHDAEPQYDTGSQHGAKIQYGTGSQHDAKDQESMDIPEYEVKEKPEEKIFVKSSQEESQTQVEKALQNYRSMVLEKRGKQVEKQNKRLLYTAASFFMVVICVIGITTMNNYQKMKEVEDVLYVMKNSVSGGQETDTEPQKQDNQEVIVESIASDVKPLKEKQQAQQEQKAKEQQKQKKDKAGTEKTGASDQKAEGQSAENQKAAEQKSQSRNAADQKSQSQNSQNQSAADQNSQGQNPADQNSQGQNPADQKGTEQKPENQKQESQETGAQENQKTAPQYYTVQAGDTLESICRKIYQNKNMVAALCQANGIENGDKIQAGQKLLLPQ